MKNKLLAFLLTMASISSFGAGNSSAQAAKDLANKVSCSAEINGMSQVLIYKPELQYFEAKNNSINVAVTLFDIRGTISASVTVDVDSIDLSSTTGFMPVAKKGDEILSEFLGLFSFAEHGKASVFCTLK